MGGNVRIAFLIDENLPVDQLRSMLEPRGHEVTPAARKASDSAILGKAEAAGSLIVTADSWFLEELFRFPPGHRRCYSRAGVVQVPGVWARARVRFATYLPVIELLMEIRRTQPDHRVAMDLSRREIRIIDP